MKEMKVRFTTEKKLTSIVSLLLLGGGVALGGNYLLTSNASFAKEGQENTKTETISPEVAIAIPTNYVTEVVNQVGDAVVRIDASRTVATNVPAQFNDPVLRQFFGSQIPTIPQQQVKRGLGSGFIVSSDGLILTNAHVVEGSDRVTVTLKEGQTYEGQVLGTDSLTDVAVIKIEAVELPTVTFADSDQLQPGEWAIAIGNPLGLDNTVTTGIVSATGRTSAQVGVAEKRVNFIQTDAAINPGNSGGPLLNAQGEVIGINTAIIQNAPGIGFAIPVNSARDIAEELIAKGKVDHPYLGVQMAKITPELKRQLNSQGNFNIVADSGILILNVVPNSPAARAGLQSGDIIQEIDELKITSTNQVQQTVAHTNVGEKLALNIIRNQRQVGINVPVGVLPPSQITRR